MAHGRRALGAAWTAAAVLIAAEARSAPEDADRVYEEARAAFDKADYEKACPLFQKYYDLQPVPAALFTLAECEARWGKPARSLTHFEAYIKQSSGAKSTALQEQRTRMAYEQVMKLTALVGKVKPLVAPGITGSVFVKLDGIPVAVPGESPTVVEPGEHVLEMTTEDGKSVQKRFIVGAGEARTVVIGGPEDEPHKVPPPPPPTQGEPSSRRIGPPVWIAGGIGVAGLAVGGLFGALALGKKSDIDAHCVGHVCDAIGKQKADSGQTLAGVSTVGFVIGLAGAATAVVLYLVLPPSKTEKVAFDARGLGGTF